MNLSFDQALANIGPDSAFRIANEKRPENFYLFNTLLPEMNEPTYSIDSGSLTIRSAMAGLASTDSPYPPTGISEVAAFLEEATKLANTVKLTERAIRRIQGKMKDLGKSDSMDFIVNEALNFLEKVIVQPHLDAMEWLRGKALVTGAIDWTFNGQNLVVDYGIPAANILTTRTGTAAWDSTASAFWDDIILIQSTLGYNVRAMIAHPNTVMSIIDNDVNAIEITNLMELGNGSLAYSLMRRIGTTERPDTDFRRNITIIAYGLEGEVLNPAGPSATQQLPFMEEGKILAVGNTGRTSFYRVGEGSTEDPWTQVPLGYTHIAPTVEGGGQMGRWAQLFTPEQMPMQLHGRGVTNGLPVVETPEKICIASSDLS